MPQSTLGSRPDSPFYVQTGAFTAVPNACYIVNFAASLGAVAVTLPATPPNGTKIQFTRIDSNAYTSFCNITEAAADGGAIAYVLSFNNGTITLMFYSGTWYPFSVGFTGSSTLLGASPNASFPPNMMMRDSAGRSQVVDPTAAQDIATKNYVDSRLPSGSITMYGGATAPSGWLLCNGTTFSSATYPDLAAVLGDSYGTHSGTTYYLPNFTNMFPRGNTPSVGGGSDNHTHTLTTAGMATHQHDLGTHTHGYDHLHAGGYHTHTLSDAGQAAIAIVAGAAPNITQRRVTSSWVGTHQISTTLTVGTNATTYGAGAALRGSSDNNYSGNTGAASAAGYGTSTGPTGGSGNNNASGLTGSTDNPSTIPAYEGVAFIIKT